MIDKIIIKGARVHNLKNVNLTIPRDKLFELQGKSADDIPEEIVAVPQRKRRQRKPGKYLKA